MFHHRVSRHDIHSYIASKWIAIGITLSLISACVNLQQIRRDWPEDIPPLHQFEHVYEADRENQAKQPLESYLRWVKSFYMGSDLYHRGWNDVTPVLLEQFEDPKERRQVEQQLYELGRDIAGEWAKADDSGPIQTSQLSVWGNALNHAVAEGNVRDIIDQIERDVKDLLEGNLTPNSIEASRYHEQDEDDAFRM